METVKFVYKVGEELENKTQHSFRSDFIPLDDLCREFLDFINSVKFVNKVDITIHNPYFGPTTLRNYGEETEDGNN